MAERRERNSGIELLRILAAMGVIILHYNNAEIGGGLKYSSGWNLLMLQLLQNTAICAVNVFVLISGYFLSRSGRRDCTKPLELILQVILYGELSLLLQAGMGWEKLSLRHIAGLLLPCNWFILIYSGLYLISPYLNVLLSGLREKDRAEGSWRQRRKLLILLLLLFSFYPSAVDLLQNLAGKDYNGLSTISFYGSQHGYTIVNFALLYLIGAFLRDYEEEGKDRRGAGKEEASQGRLLLLFLGNLLLLLLWACFERWRGIPVRESTAWSYCNPLVISEAVLVFRLFKGLKLPTVSAINCLAQAAFSAYLLHPVFLPHLRIREAAALPLPLLLFHVLSCAAALYLLAFFMQLIFSFCTGSVFRALRKKLGDRRYLELKTDGV